MGGFWHCFCYLYFDSVTSLIIATSKYSIFQTYQTKVLCNFLSESCLDHVLHVPQPKCFLHSLHKLCPHVFSEQLQTTIASIGLSKFEIEYFGCFDMLILQFHTIWGKNNRHLCRAHFVHGICEQFLRNR